MVCNIAPFQRSLTLFYFDVTTAIERFVRRLIRLNFRRAANLDIDVGSSLLLASFECLPRFFCLLHLVNSQRAFTHPVYHAHNVLALIYLGDGA
jgi:hypothetical protein